LQLAVTRQLLCYDIEELMLRVAGLPHVRPNRVRLSAIERTGGSISFNLRHW
jgi:hypothetical protein